MLDKGPFNESVAWSLVLKQQIWHFFLHIESTEASFYIYDRLLTLAVISAFDLQVIPYLLFLQVRETEASFIVIG